MSQLSLLLTNDDGYSSPLFEAFVEELSRQVWCKTVQPVAPRDEQSWVAQAVTRFHPVHVESATIGGVAGYVVAGTPADCAALGITELSSERPDLLLSGINFGTNESLSFYLNSGTVGGARQGIVFGCRAIAVSLRMPRDLFDMWRKGEIEAIAAMRSDWVRASQAACRVIGRLLATDCWDGVDLYAVNLPWTVDENTAVEITRLERVLYPRIFHPFDKGVFHHKLDSLIRSSNPPHGERFPSDMEALDRGNISVSPIYYDLLPRNAKLLSALEAGFSR